MPKGLANELLREVDTAERPLRALSQEDTAHPLRPGAWSKREILGHLIDSASNNHQRFVRAQQASGLRFPGYEQEAWVSCQDYASREWEPLLELWIAYNRHLAHVLDAMPDSALETKCLVEWGTETREMSLREVAHEYVKHMRHHLHQLLG